MFLDILLKTNSNSKYNPKINDNVTIESFSLKWKIQCFYDKTIFQGNNNVYFSINSFKRIHCHYFLINDMLVLSLKHFLFLCISKYITITNHSIISHPTRVCGVIPGSLTSLMTFWPVIVGLCWRKHGHSEDQQNKQLQGKLHAGNLKMSLWK